MLSAADLIPDSEFDALLRRVLTQVPSQPDAALGWQRLAPRLALLSQPERLSRAQANYWLLDRPGPPLLARLSPPDGLQILQVPG